MPSNRFVVSAAETGKLSMLKGQFLAPWDMVNVVDKITGAVMKMCCLERGTSFGYNTLVSDFRGLPTMAKQTGKPVVFDATHSVQQPGGGGVHQADNGNCFRIGTCAVSVGVAGLFMETHKTQTMPPVTVQIW